MKAPRCIYCLETIPADRIAAARKRRVEPQFCGPDHTRLVHAIRSAQSLLKREDAFVQRTKKDKA